MMPSRYLGLDPNGGSTHCLGRNLNNAHIVRAMAQAITSLPNTTR